jgi:hypothetical protein
MHTYAQNAHTHPNTLVLRGKKFAWMPLLFFSVKRMFSSIILLPCVSLGELPNICSRLLMSDLDFVKRCVRHFFPVKEKAVDVPYCVIF